jgi:hypothetical protein
MNKIIKNLFLPVLLVASATLTYGSIKESEKIGLFKNTENQAVASVSQEIGLYSNNNSDIADLEKDLEGSLRAGDNMGGGQPQKVPVNDGLWVILLGSIGYSFCFLRQKK